MMCVCMYTFNYIYRDIINYNHCITSTSTMYNIYIYIYVMYNVYCICFYIYICMYFLCRYCLSCLLGSRGAKHG